MVHSNNAAVRRALHAGQGFLYPEVPSLGGVSEKIKTVYVDIASP
jgi:hypothetical protein